MSLKITCILTSFNRPTLIQQALRSISNQGYKNYELIVADDSTCFDVRRLVDRLSFSAVRILHSDVTPQDRAARNRLGININQALSRSTGDLICYLADDDYYWPDWFERAAAFFVSNPEIITGFGSLFYSRSRLMDYSTFGETRFFQEPVKNPAFNLDHTQVMHRAQKPVIAWPESLESVKHSDAIFFTQLVKLGSFRPIDAQASVKRLHSKNLQDHIAELQQGKLDNLRD